MKSVGMDVQSLMKSQVKYNPYNKPPSHVPCGYLVRYPPLQTDP